MKAGDLVKITDVSRSPTDCRLSGVIIEEHPYPPSKNRLEVKVRVMWQNNVVGLIPVHRLEVISESR